jgi:membrane-associated phospholipid phosphatase
MLIRIIKANPVFWGILCAFLSICSLYLFIFPPKEIFVQLNTIHTLYLDAFFLNYTILGDGVVSIAIFLVLLLMERTTMAIQVIITYLFSGLLVRVMKHIIVSPRPHAVFDDGTYHYFIEGVTYSGQNSFPSGHTTSAFALAVLLSLHDTKRARQISYLFLAIITGYSRIYLGQHFLIDVTAGALLGVLSALVVYWQLHAMKIEWSSASQLVRIQLQ